MYRPLEFQASMLQALAKNDFKIIFSNIKLILKNDDLKKNIFDFFLKNGYLKKKTFFIFRKLKNVFFCQKFTFSKMIFFRKNDLFLKRHFFEKEPSKSIEICVISYIFKNYR